MGALAIVLVMAVLVEAILQVVKGWVPESASVPLWLWQVVGGAVGIAMCVTAGVDALTTLGVQIKVVFIGQAITGVIVSRGASFVHDLWDNVNNSAVINLTKDDLEE